MMFLFTAGLLCKYRQRWTIVFTMLHHHFLFLLLLSLVIKKHRMITCHYCSSSVLYVFISMALHVYKFLLKTISNCAFSAQFYLCSKSFVLQFLEPFHSYFKQRENYHFTKEKVDEICEEPDDHSKQSTTVCGK